MAATLVTVDGIGEVASGNEEELMEEFVWLRRNRKGREVGKWRIDEDED